MDSSINNKNLCYRIATSMVAVLMFIVFCFSMTGCSDNIVINEKKNENTKTQVTRQDCKDEEKKKSGGEYNGPGVKIEIPDEFDNIQMNVGVPADYSYWSNHLAGGWQGSPGDAAAAWKAAGGKFYHGLADFRGRLGVVMKETFGVAGDYVDVVYKDGNVLHGWLQDSKAMENAGVPWAEYGHGTTYCNCLEFYIEGSGGHGGTFIRQTIFNNPSEVEELFFITSTVDYVINYGSKVEGFDGKRGTVWEESNHQYTPTSNSLSTGMNGTAITSSGDIVGDSIEEKVWNFFTSKGYSPEATAGIMGNISVESEFIVDNIQGGGKGPAAGLFQWENYNNKSERWKNLCDYAASKNKSWTDLLCQLEFAESEVSHCLETYSQGNMGDFITKLDFMQETDPERAAEIWDKCFERSSGEALSQRKQAALEYYNEFKSLPSWSDSNAPVETVNNTDICKGEKENNFGSVGIDRGEEFHQVQMNQSNCGMTCLLMAVNILIGENKYTDNQAEWAAMGSNSTLLDQAFLDKFLSSKNLQSTIGITSIGQVSNTTDLRNALSDNKSVVILSASGSYFRQKDGSMKSLNHFVLCYKAQNGKYYVNDPGSNASLGAGTVYSEEDMSTFLANRIQAIVLTRK